MGTAMLAYLRFRYRLWRSERRGLRISKRNATIFEAAEKRKASKEEIVALQSEVGAAEWFSQIEIQQLHSDYLRSVAYKLVIPIPSLGENLMWDKFSDNLHCLSEHGINKVRADIRAEKKARVELFLMWMPGVVGILGALTGLAAVLVGHR
jgi:hypothetical protein